MTPCEKKGYELGQVFKVIKTNEVFSVGSIIALSVDDQTNIPKFDLIEGSCEYRNGELTEYGGYINLSDITRIYPPEHPRETISILGATYYLDDIKTVLETIPPVD